MPDKKHDRFLRIAQERKNHVLECLQALGNCSDPSSYTYEAKELPPIFQEIIGKLAEVWYRMSCHSPYPFVPFSLGQKEELAIDGKRCKWSALMTQEDVMVHLMEGGATFVALEPIREKYTKLFGDGMCWSYPFSSEGYLGYVLLPVCEGILYLPYTGLDSDTYEQFDIQAVRMLAEEEVQKLMDSLLNYTADLYCVLADARRALPAPAQYSMKEAGDQDS